jgi:hypothetical protein
LRKFKIFLRSDKNNGTLHEDQYTFSIISRSFLFKMRNVSDRSYRENQNTHLIFGKGFFLNNSFYEIMREKYCREGQATDDKMEHAHCKHDIPMATDTHSEYGNTYCFSTAGMVLRTILNVTLFVHCLSCFAYLLIYRQKRMSKVIGI